MTMRGGQGTSPEFIAERLASMKAQDLGRTVSTVVGGSEPWVEIEGRRLLNLSSNNYLGLASHPSVIAAAVTATRQHGVGAGSSRLVAGTGPLHQQLEERLARFKGAERALLFNSGYTANVGLVPALVGPGDLVIGDELNHASLIDGCRLSRADFRRYPHRDTDSLAALLVDATANGFGGRTLVLTDSVFSMDGDLAPLAAIADLCARHGAMLVVDEAHATGCLGPGGRGLVAELGLEEGVTASMSTLSKAFGGFGAFVAAGGTKVEYLTSVARSFMFTTALPASVIAAALAALDLIEHEPALRSQLQDNARVLREDLTDAGLDTLGSETHIVPVLVGESVTALRMAERLREEGVFVVAIRPPTVPAGLARIRLSPMATHAKAELEGAAKTIARIAHELGVIKKRGAVKATT